jgi:hypothetical protein
MYMLKKILFTTILVSLAAAWAVPSYADDTGFLAKPMGSYGVGFQDFHFQDNSRCPDVYANETTIGEGDYSPENTNHCREIMMRAYYPTNESVSLGAPYYAPQISYTEDFFNMVVRYADPGMVLDFKELEALQSYSHENVAVITTGEKFPIILFSPGDNGSVQSYENIITNLVSHGYFVLAVNSLFLSGYNALPNGHVIKTSYATNDAQDLNSREADLSYVYNQRSNINQQLANIMDENNVGIMGHSAGANTVAQMIASKKYPFLKAAVAMDTDVQPSFESFDTPFLHELSGSRYWTGKYGVLAERISYLPKYQLKKNNYLVGLVVTEDNLVNPYQFGPLYSLHGSFTDDSTLHYMSVYQQIAPALQRLQEQAFVGNSPGNPYGSGYGGAIIDSANTYIVQFFDTYLKTKTNPVFNTDNCQTLSPNTIISCGPTVFPYK